MKLFELIKEMADLPGPSGFEEKVAARAREILAPLVDEIYTDAMGNLIGVKRCGREKAFKLLFDAHMDEVGLIVTGQKDGFLKFSALGSLDPRILPASEVRILAKKELLGVITCLPPHVSKTEDREKAVPADELFIDAGLTAEEAGNIVPPGTPVVFAAKAKPIGKELICGKALDDRACSAIILRMAGLLRDKPLEADVYYMLSVQEELGTRGAGAGAFGIMPDYCVAVDVTHAETPDSKKDYTMRLGLGPAIGVGPNMNKNITNALIRTAKANGIAYQTEVMPGSSGTNAWPIQISRNGVSTAVLSLPLRYMHSPIEAASITDAEALVQLLYHFALTAGRDYND